MERTASRPKGGWLVLLTVLAAAVPSTLPAQDDSPTELDLIQEQIRQTRAHGAARVAGQYRTYPRLAEDYLRGYAPLLAEAAVFSIHEDEGWAGPGGRETALHRRIERDMRQWHPVFMLTFLETLLDRRPAGLYITMLDLPGASVAAALERRLRERVVMLQDSGREYEDAYRIAERQLSSESGRLWKTMASVAEDNIVPILAQALAVDPVSARLNLVARVHGVLVTVASEGLYGFLHERVREGPGSHTLPESIHTAIDGVLLDPELETTWKERRFAELLELFVVLQNHGSRDRLLLIFDDFDKYDKIFGDRRAVFGEMLNRKVVGFVDASERLDPQHELALDVVDQLTVWVVVKVSLVHPQVSHQRVLDVLCLLEERRPAMLLSYIERFYRDFHAFNPAGFETVVLHLTDILIDFARAEPLPDEDPYPLEAVMRVLRWYDRSLAEIGPTLPAVDLEFVEDEQRVVIEKIYDCFETALANELPVDSVIDRHFIETLLLLFERIAHLAEPEDIQGRLVEPLIRAAFLDPDPLLELSAEKLAEALRPVGPHASSRRRSRR